MTFPSTTAIAPRVVAAIKSHVIYQTRKIYSVTHTHKDQYTILFTVSLNLLRITTVVSLKTSHKRSQKEVQVFECLNF